MSDSTTPESRRALGERGIIARRKARQSRRYYTLTSASTVIPGLGLIRTRRRTGITIVTAFVATILLVLGWALAKRAVMGKVMAVLILAPAAFAAWEAAQRFAEPVAPDVLPVVLASPLAGLLDDVRVAIASALRHQRYRHEDMRRDAGAAGAAPAATAAEVDGGDGVADAIAAMGRAPMVKTSRRMPPTPVAAP